MNDALPRIGVVMIGVNVKACLSDCIRSVHASDYPRQLMEIIYVDGGSSDGSVNIAESLAGVKVIALNDRHPTPGRGRNAGWRATDAPLIQFLDADTTVDPDWFRRGLAAMQKDVTAVCGRRQEKYPNKNIFHRLTQMEWRYEIGPCRYFGGDVLIRRTALEQTGGFDERLVAGEDPELSYRIRHNGGLILRIDAQMTTHDINMRTLQQYGKRAYRSGYAYAEIGLRFIGRREKMWLRELVRISAAASLPPMIWITGKAGGFPVIGAIAALLIFLRPLLRVKRIQKVYRLNPADARLYAMHAALVIYPQFFGVMRYLLGRIFGRPLKNKGVPYRGA